MAEYTTAVTVDLEADALFAWVSDPSSVAEYVPAVAEVSFVGGDAVLVTLADGSPCAAWLRVYGATRQLAWGTDDGGYRGELHVAPRRGVSGCTLTVTVRVDALDAAALAAATDACLAAAADTVREAVRARMRLPDPVDPAR